MAAKAAANLEKVKGVINTVLEGLDEHIADYIISVLEDDPLQRVSWVSGGGEEGEGGEAEGGWGGGGGGQGREPCTGNDDWMPGHECCVMCSVVKPRRWRSQDATHPPMPPSHSSPSPTYTNPPHASQSHRTWRHRWDPFCLARSTQRMTPRWLICVCGFPRPCRWR